MKTYFAPARRASAEQLERDIASSSDNPLMNAVLSTAGGLIAVLNEERQLLIVNHAYLEFLGIDDAERILGLRLGESVGCGHAVNGPGGCGTGKACRSCGAAIALLACAQRGETVEADCALSASVDGVRRDIDIRVRAAPLSFEDRTFTLLFLEDISATKRREALEQTFLHDMNNALQGLLGTAALLAESQGRDPDLVENLHMHAKRICAEVGLQRALIEREDYVPRLERVTVRDLFDAVQRTVKRHPAALGKTMVSLLPAQPLELRTDRVLVERIVINMVINGLEATPEGGTVHLRAERNEGYFQVVVHNDGVIEDDVRPRVFQRYFSTKPGAGRGHGTFAMRLFGERFLRGKVTFTSSERDGTEFVLQLPVGEEPIGS